MEKFGPIQPAAPGLAPGAPRRAPSFAEASVSRRTELCEPLESAALNSPPVSGQEGASAATAAGDRHEIEFSRLFGRGARPGALVAPIAPAAADEFTPAQKKELGEFVKDYLVNNPEVLRQAIDALDKHDKQVAEAERQKIVSDNADELFSSKYQATVGNPKGTATLVEFFDYNCHFCKGALPDIARLMKDDPNLKLVLKDFPVLGPGLGRGGQGGHRRAQPVAGRPLLAVPLQAPEHARADRQGPGPRGGARDGPRHGPPRQGHGGPGGGDGPA